MSFDDWRDMREAPKDGTHVLVFAHGQQHVAWYDNGRWIREADSYNVMILPEAWQGLPPSPYEFPQSNLNRA